MKQLVLDPERAMRAAAATAIDNTLRRRAHGRVHDDGHRYQVVVAGTVVASVHDQAEAHRYAKRWGVGATVRRERPARRAKGTR